MIRLSPTTSSQTVSIIPRVYTVASDLSMVIVEDGTRKTQTITGITSALSANGNFLEMSIAFSILTAENSYSDNTTDHTLNSNKYNQYVGTDTDDQKYIII
jgi:hypothetical protein